MSSAPLHDLLQKAHQEILDLRRRQYALDKFKAELDDCSRGKTFWIHNDIVWNMILDHRDKNVIDLASWAKAAYSSGGFFGTLQAHHVRALGSKRKWTASDEFGDRDFSGMLDETFAEAHCELFSRPALRPGQSLPPVTPNDVQQLRDVFSVAVEPLMRDRNGNRAHVFEGTQGTSNMLDLDATRQLFEAIQKMLNDIALISSGETWSASDLNSASTGQTADELVDMVLLPEWARTERQKVGRSRESVYDWLHHDRDSEREDAPSDGLFNSGPRLRRLFPSVWD